MNKKIFGIRVGTIISFVMCLTIAFLIWLYANYAAMTEMSIQDTVTSLFGRG